MRRYARSQKGKRALGAKPSKRGRNVSIIAAISLQGKVTHVNLLGGTDGLTLEAFIIRKLVPKLWKGAAVFMDNYSIHKGEEVENAIDGAGARLIYLPPYSPDFSPLENCWSKVKQILRSVGARTHKALDSAIEEAFSQISKQDFHNWFTHCCYCTSSI